MSTYDVRKQAYAAGMAQGAKDERERLCDQLESIVGSADLEGQVLALVGQLQAKPAASAQAGDDLAAADRLARLLAAGPRQGETRDQLHQRAWQEVFGAGASPAPAPRDRGDEIADAMDRLRGVSTAPAPAPAPRTSGPRDLGDDIADAMDRMRGRTASA